MDFLFEKNKYICVLDICDPTNEQSDICGVVMSELCRTFMGGSCVSYLHVGLVLSSVQGLNNKSM